MKRTTRFFAKSIKVKKFKQDKNNSNSWIDYRK